MQRFVTIRFRRLVPVALLLFICCLAVPVFAAEVEQSPADSTIGWVFRWLNFALVFGGLGYFLAKKAPALFASRVEKIVASITEAGHAKEGAERRLREAEEKLAGIEREIGDLREQAKRHADSEAERIRALTRQEAKKIERAAQAEIQAAARAGRLQLKSQGARLAIERADALLRKEITPQSDATIFHSFLTDLEGSVN